MGPWPNSASSDKGEQRCSTVEGQRNPEVHSSLFRADARSMSRTRTSRLPPARPNARSHVHRSLDWPHRTFQPERRSGAIESTEAGGRWPTVTSCCPTLTSHIWPSGSMRGTTVFLRERRARFDTSSVLRTRPSRSRSAVLHGGRILGLGGPDPRSHVCAIRRPVRSGPFTGRLVQRRRHFS